jgi:hypothetical protein
VCGALLLLYAILLFDTDTHSATKSINNHITARDKTTLEFFEIDEAGLISGDDIFTNLVWLMLTGVLSLIELLISETLQ